MDDLQPWYWRSLPLENRTGSQVFDCLFRNKGSIAALLESPYRTFQDQPALSRFSICAGMPRIRLGRTQMWTPAVGEILPFLRRLLNKKGEDAKVTAPSHLPFTGGWLGWLGYDLAWEIEQLPRTNPDSLPFPVAFWYEPAAFAVLDHVQQILWLAATDESELDQFHQRLEQPAPSPHRPISSPPHLLTAPSPSSRLNPTMKLPSCELKSTFKRGIFFRQIFPCGSRRQPPRRVGRFIVLYNKLIRLPLLTIGRLLGEM